MPRKKQTAEEVAAAVSDPNLFEFEVNVFINKSEQVVENEGKDDETVNCHLQVSCVDQGDYDSILAMVTGKSFEEISMWRKATEAMSARRTTFTKNFTDHKCVFRVGTRAIAHCTNVELNAFALVHDKNRLTLKVHVINSDDETVGKLSLLLRGRSRMIVQRGEHWKSQQELDLENDNNDD